MTTETAGAGPEGVARLDELAEVTGGYAKFSRSAFGFAFVAVGAWLGGAAIVRGQSRRWSDVLLAFAPLGASSLLLQYALAGVAAFFVIGGVWEHVTFLRLERRFAGLRSPAA